MNFKTLCEGYLKSNGLFDSQIADIMGNVILSHPEMKNRWLDNVNEYPEQLKTIVLMGVNHETLKYIKERCPDAWFRPIFDKEHSLRKKFESECMDSDAKLRE